MDKKRNRGALFFISVLLHSLFVLLPWQEKSRPVALSPSQANSVSVVDASLLELSAAESQPVPAAPANPPAPVSPPLPALISPPPPIPVDLPPVPTPNDPIAEVSVGGASLRENRPITQPLPEAVPYSSDAIPSALPSGEPSAPPSEIPLVDKATITEEWDNMIGHFQRQDDLIESSSLRFILDTYGELGQTDQFFDENGQPKLNDFTHYHFTRQTSEQVLETVIMPEVANNTGFDIQQQENFTAGLAYQLSQGDMLRYFIVVPLRDRSGSVLIVSDSLPTI